MFSSFSASSESRVLFGFVRFVFYWYARFDFHGMRFRLGVSLAHYTILFYTTIERVRGQALRELEIVEGNVKIVIIHLRENHSEA